MTTNRYTNVSDADLAARAMAVQAEMTANSSFQNEPVDLDFFSTLIPEARGARRKEVTMDTYDEILRALGRIEGQLIEIAKLSERVSKIEMRLSWMIGGWAALAGASAYLCKAFLGK